MTLVSWVFGSRWVNRFGYRSSSVWLSSPRGSCDRSCLTRSPPTHSFASHRSPVRERLCLVEADADLSGANSSPQRPLHTQRRATACHASSCRIQGCIRVGHCGRGLNPSSGPGRTTVASIGWLGLLRLVGSIGQEPCLVQTAASARQSAYDCFRLSICQMMVANLRITATRAIEDPLRRLIRLNHARRRASFRNA